jgi:hypothetical protein
MGFHLAPLFRIFKGAKHPKRTDRQSLHFSAEGDAFTAGVKNDAPVKTCAVLLTIQWMNFSHTHLEGTCQAKIITY